MSRRFIKIGETRFTYRCFWMFRYLTITLSNNRLLFYCFIIIRCIIFNSPGPKAHRRAYSVGRHPSSVVVVGKHFQTTSPLKPWSRFLPYFTYSIYRQRERIKLLFCPIRIWTLVTITTYSSHWLIMEKHENWHLLQSHSRYFDKRLQKCSLTGLLPNIPFLF